MHTWRMWLLCISQRTRVTHDRCTAGTIAGDAKGRLAAKQKQSKLSVSAGL